MGDKEFIEKIKSLSFMVRKTESEQRVGGIRHIDSAEEVYEESTLPTGYETTGKNGKPLIVIHGGTDRRQAAEIIAEKLGE